MVSTGELSFRALWVGAVHLVRTRSRLVAVRLQYSPKVSHLD
jgi:hypothetical protein